MIGYKLAFNNITRVIITLEIPKDALTNINRTSVAVKETAKYRANKVKVVKIEDKDGNTYPDAVSGCFIGKFLEYRVGEILEEASYDTDIENVCSSGIHFFLERHVAEQYDLSLIDNRLLQTWHENGQKCAEGIFKNGKEEGVWTYWYDNGQKNYTGMFKNGKEEGVWKYWHYNGHKKAERIYKDGEKEGVWTFWYGSGQKKAEGIYKDGEKEGVWTYWYDNGQKKVEGIHRNGEREGVWTLWYNNGQKECTGIFKHGKEEGVWTFWYGSGYEFTRMFKNGKEEDIWNY